MWKPRRLEETNETRTEMKSVTKIDALKYLRSVADWVERWKARNPSDGLSRETAFAGKHNALAIIEFMEYLLNERRHSKVIIINYRLIPDTYFKVQL